MALEIFKLVGSVFVDTDKADKSLKKSDKNAEGLGKKLVEVGKAAGKFAMGVVGAASAAGAGLVALAETTREYRTEQGKLETAFQTGGFAAGVARDTYEALNGVLGDSGKAVEAASHLAKLATTEEDLAKWTDICTGVYATFGDSLPIEGLTEAANETAKTGSLTGALADALNWAGVSEDSFQASLDACATEQERQALITETLNGLYDEAAESYREINGEVIAANEAQDKLNAAWAAVGGVIEPVVTQGKLLVAEFLEKLIPVASQIAEVVIPFLVTGISTVSGWIGTLIDKLGESGITFDSVMTGAQTLFEGVMTFFQGIWTTVGQPIWGLIMQTVGIVMGAFQQHMPAIKEFVRQTFTDIQNIWENNLQPALQAIGDFIENILAPAFTWVFEKVVGPVVDNTFKGIQDLWNKTLKPVLEGILTFIEGVFSGDMTKIFKGLIDTLDGIWAGLETIFKTPINAVIDLINNFIRGINGIEIPDWVPGVGGLSLNIPTIPRLYEGGVLERGQVGLMEGNGAEAVVPLHNNRKWINAVAEDMDSAIGGTSSRQVVTVLSDILSAMEEIAQMGITLDTGALVGGLAKPMDKKLGQIQAQKARA